MKKLSFRLNLLTSLRVLHALVAAALIAGCIHLGISLYDQFYLPYNLEDAPVRPSAAAVESPATRSVIGAAEQLELRLASGTADRLPDVFWPGVVPTGTES